jgi:ATP-dependent exoDNAse (exonuclease V) beta subunit
VLRAEEQLYVPITEFTEAEKKFKGFIDLVVYSKKDEKIHLIDWKTCSWGWRREKKNDKIMAYQLVFYKHFYARKYEVDPKMWIVTSFIEANCQAWQESRVCASDGSEKKN